MPSLSKLTDTIVFIWHFSEILRFIIAIQNQRHVFGGLRYVDKVREQQLSISQEKKIVPDLSNAF
jgi:hypothetical protein